MDLAFLNSNPVVQIAGMEGDMKYWKETVLFCYCTVIALGAAAGGSHVAMIGSTYIRAFTSLGFALPLALGKLPGGSIPMKSFDQFFVFVLAASLFVMYVYPKVINTNDLKNLSGKALNVFYAIVKGNAAGLGYVMTKEAMGDSMWAPFVGAFVAVNGHRLIEHGVGGAMNAQWDNDTVLAVFGGIIYWALTTHLAMSALVARVCLVGFRAAGDYVNYHDIIDKFGQNTYKKLL